MITCIKNICNMFKVIYYSKGGLESYYTKTVMINSFFKTFRLKMRLILQMN